MERGSNSTNRKRKYGHCGNNQGFDQQNQGLGRNDQHFRQNNQRFDRNNQRFDRNNQRFDRNNQRFDRNNQRFDSNGRRVEANNQSSFDRKKQRFERNNKTPAKRPTPANYTNHPLVQRVQDQEGVRARLVLSYSSFDTPFTTLHNAVTRANTEMKIMGVNQKNQLGQSKYQLTIANEKIVDGFYDGEMSAKRELAGLALTELKKTCFIVFRKIHPRDSPQLDMVAPSRQNEEPKVAEKQPESSSKSIGGIGEKLMKLMGWSGGGLGSKEQGRTDIVRPYLQINRQGIGSKNIVQEVTKILSDYAHSGDMNSVAFSSDFTKEERATIHQVSRKLNLKSRSYGKDEDRVLVIQSKISPWDLVHMLLDMGKENDQYVLLVPENFKESDD